MADLDKIVQALVVKPGDSLIIRVDPDRTDGFAEIEDLKRQIESRLPDGVGVMVMAVDEIAVACPDPRAHAHKWIGQDHG